MFGYQVAFCWRNTAIYGGLVCFGVLYSMARDRDILWLRWVKKPIGLRGLLLFLAPMAFDGFSHIFGLRDMSDNVNMDMWYGSLFSGSQVFSFNWWLRIFTGSLAALGFVRFAYPRFDKAMEQSEVMRMAYRQSSVSYAQQPSAVDKQGTECSV